MADKLFQKFWKSKNEDEICDNDDVFDVDNVYDLDKNDSQCIDEEAHIRLDDLDHEDINIDGRDLNYNEFPGDEKDNENSVVTPYVNQMFSSLECAESFFRNYALKCGFSIKIKTSQKRVHSDEVYARMFVCRYSGKNICINVDVDEEKIGASSSKRRRDKLPRTECKVRMYVVYKKNVQQWVVTSLHLEHNHEMVTPSKVNLIERSRHVTPAARNLINTLNKSGIPPSAVMNVFSNLGGGVGNVGFGSQHIRNVLRDERKKRLGMNDAQDGLNLLNILKEESGGKYFVKTQVDEEDRLQCIVWVDPRCLMAYQNFGDVVAFDTTYRTNKYSMPFVPFTGVNHHYQSILFGFALMRDEKDTSFEWVLRTWLEAVGYKQPLVIITDQDLAMGKAIASVLPNTYHLLCSWHISSKFPEKLANYYSKYPHSFKDDFNNCIYNSLTDVVFEERWSDLVKKYELQEHSWLQGMYELKRQWIRAYTKVVFAAGQTTTSRSEGMNAFFDSYVSSSTSIREFIENAQRALDRQFLKEKEEDFVTKYRTRSMRMHHALEYHAANLYTKEMFRQFQSQLIEVPKYCVVKFGTQSNENYKYYELYRPLVDPSKRNHYVVIFDKNDSSAGCICKMLEHLGIPCRHILAILQKRNIVEIPEAMIRYRWTTNANKVEGILPYNVNGGNVLTEMSPTDRFNNLTMASMSFCHSGMASMERYNYAMSVLGREVGVMDGMPVEGSEWRGSGSHCSDNQSNVKVDPILDPIISQTKGRKRTDRYKSPVELISQEKQSRRCAFCKVEAKHDKRNCPKRLEMLNNTKFEKL